ncbi:hypothetical protein L2E82_49305 [Cichorium intybus]|uniref:Uncharacterized protein n=1 Tax=Cichorium intybus TaxID=13427 RepID=A0ACB8Z0J0_CICIN|nr:hypothetical protein L2E82_49305 [Cichorium intybus]
MSRHHCHLHSLRFAEEYAIEAIGDWREIDYPMDTLCMLERTAQHQCHCSWAFFPKENTLPVKPQRTAA